MKQCLDLTEKCYENIDILISDLTNNFFPECEIIKYPEWEEGISKYTFDGFILFKYFDQLYKCDVVGNGNGGWLSVDECNVSDVYPVKEVEKVVVTLTYEKI